MKNKGVLLAGGVYVLWGFLPAYWKLLHTLPALEILSHRIVWALVFTCIVITVRGNWRWLGEAVRNRKTMLIFIASSACLTLNWLTYIWAVNSGYIVESSLGYFITPLLNVGMGVLFFSERMRPAQWIAIGLAAAGVVYLAVVYGHVPWIGLTLAVSFGLYGLLRKQAPLPSLQGLTLETALVSLPALAVLLYLEFTGQGAFGHAGLTTTLLLAFAGVVTAVPLIMFAAGVRLIPLTTLGILQFISPTIQFFLGVVVYGEPFNMARLVGFGLVWLALIVFTVEVLMTRRKGMAQVQPSQPTVARAS